MSAHAYAPPGRAPARDRQPHLFVLPGGASRTLDAELRLAWTAVEAGAPAACVMCDGRMEPLPAPAVGGACTSCGTTLE
jgi:hypothetical protein